MIQVDQLDIFFLEAMVGQCTNSRQMQVGALEDRNPFALQIFNFLYA